MRAIVVGAGDVGYDVARLLSLQRHDVTVVDTDPRKVEQVRETLDVLAIVGSGTSARTLREARIEDADLMVAVTDIEAALGDYADVLGLPRSEVVYLESQQVKATLLPVGDCEIELIEPTDPEGGIAKFIERRGEGLHHICFETDDIEQLAATLKSNGVKFNCEPWVMPSGSTVAFVVAPDEVSVELIQRPAA